jgi:ribosome maturation protein Sdo1
LNNRKQIENRIFERGWDISVILKMAEDYLIHHNRESFTKKYKIEIYDEIYNLIVSGKLKIPPQFTGQAYGIINEYKEKEDWLPDGSLKVIVNIPVGLQMEFYDKLNAITHGSVLSEEIKTN